ncbi:MAG: AgmX/PglI C-terminal domain-containing protein, partial [Deltaproteobacteria bacterium]|nr:AgmX/PglI C-terminal domain-containing protein [Deltaproteobacteria bacterium]
PVVASRLPVQRVVLYRNGVGYFERAGKVDGDEVKFKVRKSQVGDFLASLTVVSRDGQPVEFVSFPIEKERRKEERTPEPAPGCWPGCPWPPPGTCPTVPPDPDAPDDGVEEDDEETLEVVVRLQGGKTAHDVLISYVVESPIWRPTYRIVLSDKPDQALLQGWAVVQNTSGEDWTDVTLSVTEGAPLTFRADLGNPFVPARPLVTDRGEVVQAAVASSVSVSDETRRRLARLDTDDNREPKDAANERYAEAESAWADVDEEASLGLGDIGRMGHGAGGGGVGYGRGAVAARSAPAPDVRLGDSSAMGSLSRDVIRRVVSQHRARIRHCYEVALQASPGLAGRVVVRFQISQDGTVAAADATTNTTGNTAVGSCVAAVVRRMSFPQSDSTTTVSYPFEFQPAEGGSDAPATEVVDLPAAPPAGLEASGARASLALLALGSQEGGITTYRSAGPVSIADQASTLVAILNRDVEAHDALLFRPDPGVPASAGSPFRVVRFVNQTDVTLERGPVAIFATERFLGQGVLEPLPAGATTSIPYAIERGVTISVESGSDVEEASLVKVVHGRLTIKRYSVRKTKYVVQNLTGRPGKLFIQHTRRSGWELKNLPAGSEEVDALTVIVPVELATQAKTEIEILERSPMTQEVQLLDPDARAAVRLYLAGPAVDGAMGPTLRRALEIGDEVGTIDTDIERFTEEREQVQTWTYEVQNNLYSIQGIARAGELRTRLTQRLTELQKKFDELQTKITDLTARRGERYVELTELLREVDFEVPEPAAEAAPASANDAASQL